jgi:Tfp pilus assembly protein PilF
MNSRINYNLGLLHLQLSNNGEAEKQLKKAIEKESGNFDYQYALAHFYVTSSQFNKAKRQLSTLKKQFPNDVNVQQLNNFLLNQTN